MFSVTITEKGGKTTVKHFDQPEVTIGRIQGNDITLPKSNISKRHARIINNSGSFVVIDSKSTNGTYINGKRIDGPFDLQDGDKIFVGDFTLQLSLGEEEHEQREDEDEGAKKAPTPPPPPKAKEIETEQASERAAAKSDDVLDDDEWSKDSELESDWADDWSEGERHEATRTQNSADFADEQLPEVEPDEDVATFKPAPLSEKSQSKAQGKAAKKARKSETRQSPARASNNGGIDLGPLSALWNNPQTESIFVNGPERVFSERDGQIDAVATPFSSAEDIVQLIRQLSGNDAPPTSIDAVLPDGSLMTAVVPPAAIYPTLVLRKSLGSAPVVDDFVSAGVLSAEAVELLDAAIKGGKNILVVSHKERDAAQMLEVLASLFSESERIVTVEQGLRLRLEHPNHVQLRHPIMNGTLLFDLEPRRIILHPAQTPCLAEILVGAESEQFTWIGQLPANNAEQALERMAAQIHRQTQWALGASRAQVVASTQLVIVLLRDDNILRVSKITEVTGADDYRFKTQDIFVLDTSTKGGKMKATGAIPKFYEQLRDIGIQPNVKIFSKT